LRGRDFGSAVAEAQKKIKQQVVIPEGYRLIWAGQYQFQQEANAKLMVIVPITLLLIYVILLGAFGSHKQALLIMCSVPLAGLGGVSALLLTNTYFSISAAVGFIALCGVTVQNGVILISYISQLRKSGMSLEDAAFKGALDRMRPVLMTAIVAMLGLVPAAMSNGIGSQSQKPFAIVIIGGLMSATVLKLIVLPTLYALVERRAERLTAKAQDPVLLKSLVPLLAVSLLSCTLTGCTPGSKASISSTAHVDTTSPPQPPDNKPRAIGSTSQDILIDAAQSKEVGLRTEPVSVGVIYKTVDSPGRVSPNAELTTLVSTPSPGRASEVNARLGDIVQTGQVMAVIKSEVIGQVQSDLLQSALQERADIKQQEVQMKLSRITADRETRLFNEQVSAKADLQAAQNQLEKDEANLAALKSKLDATLTTAQARLSLLGARSDSAQKVVAERKIDPWVVIRAPRGGLVIERTINPGEMSDGTKPLFTLANLSEVWLLGDIFEKDIESVHKGQEAEVSIDSLPEHTFPARIIWVGDAISNATRSLPVRANVPNPDQLLKPGMFARMRISVGTAKVLQVPKAAVVQKGDEDLVFVQKSDGVFRERQVETGASDENSVEIRKGLSLGDRVVVHGATSLLGASMKSSEGG
jgi:multidrug efflux pump subunit AcrA (membrane-fusion protein)